LLLNSDTYLKENSILTTFKYLETRPKVGVVSARLIFPDGRYQSVAQRFPSPKYLLMELLRLQKFLPKKQAGKLLLGAFFNHDENTEVDWVWGAYFMFRKEILDRLPEKKLDDSYFMYFEDMQWCMDIKKLGYQIHYYADAEVVHIMGGSSGSKTKLMEQYEPVFLKRNYSKVEVWLIQKLKKMLTP
jgi:GT2 family glycosyltransferase